MAILLYGLATSVAQAASDPIRYALCDLRVLYLYDDPAVIDWPTIYYLNDQYGCRVDITTIEAGPVFTVKRREVAGKQLAAYRFSVVSSSATRFDSVYAQLWSDRRPDIVLIGSVDSAGLTARFAAVTTSLKTRDSALFNVVRVARATTNAAEKAITLNAQELFAKYRERLMAEVPLLLGETSLAQTPKLLLSRYTVVSKSGEMPPDFLSGLRSMRLTAVIDSLLKDGAVRQTIHRKAESYLTNLKNAETQSDSRRLKSVVSAFHDLTDLREAADVEPTLASLTEFGTYLGDLIERVKQLAISETGVNWDGEIVLRDSPYGSKVKFISKLVVAGPSEVRIGGITFSPYWDSSAVTLDGEAKIINPHQSLVREYLIDIDKKKLESRKSDSLKFSVEIEAEGIPLTLTSAIPVWSGSKLSVHFEPNFHFVQPLAATNVEKLMSSMALNLVILKPIDYAGKVRVNLETPAGMFAGSYRQDMSLEKGQVSEAVRIPFSITKLFELGIQNMGVSLVVDGRIVARDTGLVRIAGCHISDSVKIALLSDTTGYLEDILRMTDANWQPLTNRALEVGELGTYNSVLVGSGMLKYFPSFRRVRARIEDFIRDGGTFVVFGQPESWPSQALPLSLAPIAVMLSGSSVQVANANHDLLKHPNAIVTSGLFSYFERPTQVMAAVVSPCQPVLTGPKGEILLSVSPLGKGKIVFCGLPLVEMVGKLNVDAIHLLANILNY